MVPLDVIADEFKIRLRLGLLIEGVGVPVGRQRHTTLEARPYRAIVRANAQAEGDGWRHLVKFCPAIFSALSMTSFVHKSFGAQRCIE